MKPHGENLFIFTRKTKTGCNSTHLVACFAPWFCGIKGDEQVKTENIGEHPFRVPEGGHQQPIY
jgi:hypothetical protein